ncbi:SEC-C metal-binding domain-containing protein [Uliginosibacterium flavum]|uniref:SEC-C metal-binding domain-containing protein n=1 Tax=Uliginosibacterium flavum TaxID=1396831 RepID=A0ABV2THN9_9RHOO
MLSEASYTPIRAEDVPDRNEDCPCGSGKKYKKCCGAPEKLH